MDWRVGWVKRQLKIHSCYMPKFSGQYSLVTYRVIINNLIVRSAVVSRHAAVWIVGSDVLGPSSSDYHTFECSTRRLCDICPIKLIRRSLQMLFFIQ